VPLQAAPDGNVFPQLAEASTGIQDVANSALFGCASGQKMPVEGLGRDRPRLLSIDLCHRIHWGELQSLADPTECVSRPRQRLPSWARHGVPATTTGGRIRRVLRRRPAAENGSLIDMRRFVRR